MSSSNQTELKLNRSPYDLVENNGLMLYKKNEQTDYMSVILDGRVEIHSGKHDFFSEVSRWFILCPKILLQRSKEKSTSFFFKPFKENFDSLMQTVSKEKPNGIKGDFIISAFITSTMGISYRLKISK